MDIDLAAIKLKKIIACVKEGKANGLEAKEILIDLEQVYPPRTIIKEIEKPLKTPEKKLEYNKNYRLWKKEDKKIDKERDKLEAKIQKALERVNFFCYSCKESIKISNPKDNKHDIVQKANRTFKSIIIINKCPKCGSILKGFGGKIEKP